MRFDSGLRDPYHARAMGNPLLQRRTPQEYAANAQVIDIEAKAGEFERLAEALEADLGALDPSIVPPGWRDAKVTGQFSFGFAAVRGNMPAAEGHVAVTVTAVCQRCLQACALPLRVDLRLLFGVAGEDRVAGDDYEFWELQDGELCLAELIDEALVMALPFAAMHDDNAECLVVPLAAEEVAEKADEMTTPFANLKAQMARKN
jgi:uncharacterized metal-binding protein YceD (DUF177 family)